MVYLFFLCIFVYILILFLLGKKSFFESTFFAIILFFGVNSFYFWIVSLFNLKLVLENLLIIHATSIIFFIFYNRKYFKNSNFKFNRYLIIIFFALVSLIIIFKKNTESIDNGYRLPIPSYTEDASQHLNYTFRPLIHNKLMNDYYPYSFHGNAWLFIKLATQIFNKVDDFVFITNIFSLYIWLILFLILSLISIIVYDLVIQVRAYSKLRGFLVVLVSLFLGSMVTFYFIEYGFFSNLFNQLFLLAIIYLVSRNDKNMLVFLAPLSFGYFYSYSFFMPVLMIFYGYLFLIKRKKEFLFLFFLSLILLIIFFVRILLSPTPVSYLIVAAGGFPTYSLVTVLIYLLTSFFFLKRAERLDRKIDENGMLGYLSIFAILSLFYAILFAVFQLILKGEVSYSFHKIFAIVSMFLSILASAGFIIFIEEVMFNKSKIYLSWKLWGLTILVLILTALSGFNINPPLKTVFAGTSNFFTNNKEKYNTVIFALENFSDYENVIYIDGDYQSTRWATLSYLPTKFNVIYNRNDVTNFKNYDYYVSELNKINSTTLVLNPSRFLEVDCDAKNLIKLVTESPEKILIYPFDLDLFNKNCISKKKIELNANIIY